MEDNRGQKGELVLCARMSSGVRSFQLLANETGSLHTVCLGLNFAPRYLESQLGLSWWIAEEGHLEKDAGGI